MSNRNQRRLAAKAEKQSNPVKASAETTAGDDVMYRLLDAKI